MKKILFIFLLSFFVTNHNAQTNSENSGMVNNSLETLTRAANARQGGFGSVRVFVNPSRRIEGSIYMFEDWNNLATIHTKENSVVTVDNINFNLRRNRIVSKIRRDSIYVFDLRLLNKITIQGKTFKKLVPDLDGRIFEVLFETDKGDLLSFHYLKIVEGSANPMVNRKVDKFKQAQELYLYIDGQLIPIRMRKKDILNALAKDDTQKKEIIKYYKDNKLSYKSKEDLKKVLTR